MLESVKSLLSRSKGLNERDAWNYAVTNNFHISNKIKDWIIEQLDGGYDGKGEIIGIYSFATENITNGRKRAGEPYDLNDTGFFRASIVVVPKLFVISIYANGKKTDVDIVQKYGVEILQLMEKNKAKLKELILDEYIKYTRKTIFQHR